jgi:hypothetical protein
MPRFYFDFHDGEVLRDEIGTDLPSLDSARIRSVALSAVVLRDQAKRFWQGDEWRLDVRNESGLVLFTLTFMATVSSAIPNLAR